MMNQRLLAIAHKIQPGAVLADIGTDHAQLPIWLVQNGILQKAYACDVAEGPLQTARANIDQAGLQDQIIPLLSDGFDRVPDDITAAVLAGMGFYTIRDILAKADPKLLAGLSQLIVQSNTDLKPLRTWIMQKGWSLTDEELVFEKGHAYVIMTLNVHEKANYTSMQLLCGPLLLEKGGEAFAAYCQKQLQILTVILQHNPNDVAHYWEYQCWQKALRQAQEKSD